MKEHLIEREKEREVMDDENVEYVEGVKGEGERGGREKGGVREGGRIWFENSTTTTTTRCIHFSCF